MLSKPTYCGHPVPSLLSCKGKRAPCRPLFRNLLLPRFQLRNSLALLRIRSHFFKFIPIGTILHTVLPARNDSSHCPREQSNGTPPVPKSWLCIIWMHKVVLMIVFPSLEVFVGKFDPRTEAGQTEEAKDETAGGQEGEGYE
jgi:hypothetical protein